MKVVEFQSHLQSDGTLSVPAGVVASIPGDKPLRVLILIAEDGMEAEWEEVSARDFGLGYADSDAVYDQLSAG